MAKIKQGETIRFLPRDTDGNLTGWAVDPEDDGLDGFSRWIGELDGLLGEVVRLEEEPELGTFFDVVLQDGEELWGISERFFEQVPGVVVLAARAA
jgi:hypothetical protein